MLCAGRREGLGHHVLVEVVVVAGPAVDSGPAALSAVALVAPEIEVFGHGAEFVAWLRQPLEGAKAQVGRPWAAGAIVATGIRPGPSRLPLRAAAPALTGPACPEPG